MVKDNILTEHQTPAVNRDDVLDVEELAYRTGITGDQAQDLIDRMNRPCGARTGSKAA